MRLAHFLRSLPVIFAASRYLISFNANPSLLSDFELSDGETALLNAESIEILKSLKVEKDIRIGKNFHCQVAPLDAHSLTILKQSSFIKDIFPDIDVTISEDAEIKGVEVFEKEDLGEITIENKDNKEEKEEEDKDKHKEEEEEENNYTSEFVQFHAPDHLVRLSSKVSINAMPEPREMNYYFSESGNGILAYVLDTGVAADHSQFGDRVIESVNFADDNTIEDLHGHGTHVAGIVGSKTYGVAKKVDIISVRVLNARGSGSLSSIIEGIEFAVNDRVTRNKKGVANMSLGSVFSNILNQAVDAAFETGLVVVVAAGNEGQPASRFSPASAKDAITVGAIWDLNDQVTTFSNFGSAVDIFAPGYLVESLDVRNYNGSIRYSGTSMASPVVAGLTASLLEKGVPEVDIKTVLKQKAQLNSPVNFPYGIIGKFLYKHTTTDIAYNGLAPEDEVPKDDEEKTKKDVNKVSLDHEISPEDLDLISWSASQNGVEL